MTVVQGCAHTPRTPCRGRTIETHRCRAIEMKTDQCRVMQTTMKYENYQVNNMVTYIM